MNTLKEYIFDRHNNYCNQKYGNNLPYSFHLDCVVAQGRKFEHLVEKYWDDCIYPALLTHDSIEDARMTYRDLVDIVKMWYEYEDSVKVADIVYCVTDEKGRNRNERKNDKYYKELSENKFAVFVKLADLSANTLYSKLTGSSMYEKYKKEFPKFKEKVYIEEYKEFFEYIENL